MSGRGRGRGRGRGAVPPSVAAAGPFGGFGRGGASTAGAAPAGPTPNQTSTRTEPGQLFPTISLPQPVDARSEEDRLPIRYAEDISAYMRTSPFFLAPTNPSVLKVDRYSDKYLAHLQMEERKGKIFAIDTDLSFFPEELHSVYDPDKAKKLASMPQAKTSLSFGDALAKLRELERTEAETKGAAAGGSDEEDGQENEDEVVYDEEEFEDETDYNFSYFDNGEDYGDYDDGDEGPVY